MKNKKNEEKRNTAGVRRKSLYERVRPILPRVIGILTGAALGLSTAVLPVFAVMHNENIVNNDQSHANIFKEMIHSKDDYIYSVSRFINEMNNVTSVSMVTCGTTTETLTTSASYLTTSQIVTTKISEKTTETTTSTVTTSTTVTSTAESTTVATTTTSPREYIVYKPSTHYIHMNYCRWFDSTCQEIDSTEGIECRRCSECHPDIEIVNEYTTTTTTTTTTETTEETETTTVDDTGTADVEEESTEPETPEDGVDTELEHYALKFVTEEERIYLCNVVGSEYGANWVSLYDKAMVVATIMNRVRDGGWSGGRENTVYNVITAPYQYNPSYAVPYYRSNVTQSCIDAVDYYFMHRSEFPNVHSFWGDGRINHFS